jgi:DNA-binding CsgD family transcriptional regulator/GAF domain-containing protein
VTAAAAHRDRFTPPARRFERQLLARVEELLHDARAELGVELPAPAGPGGPLARAGRLLEHVTWAALRQLERFDERDEHSEAVTALALRANDLEGDVRRHASALRGRRHAAVEECLGRLRQLNSSTQLIDRLCEEVVRSCGFTRSMLSRIEGNTWQPWMVHFAGDPESGREFLAWIRDRDIMLEEPTLESTLVAEPRPEIVLDAASDPRSFKPLVAAGNLTSYVVVPILPAGRVVGLLHADYGGTGRDVDLDDRDVLWTFAEGCGRLYERAVLLERIHAQQRSVHETFEMAESSMDSLTEAEIELVASDGGDATPGRVQVIEALPVPPSIDELLTAREKEVLAMVVRGYSNATIADELVIKVGTAKSHVKQILRKLGAPNRAAAISKYVSMLDAR